ncbi:SCO family protein [Algoriphagus sp. H41]|uniref:SCO family protein n=1 Tax=Algoriphagus oliviformis TaxID=2811231 RepID=A0ABS3C232_9BACT|nr:SCO family protein [Algoriphagus oliviformis]MBN7811146.1 SCO family protein [Algoriphagus oliviformis]
MKTDQLLLGMAFLLCISCKPSTENTQSTAELPILGERYVDNNKDTIYHQIADFAFVNQMGDSVKNEDVAGKIYVADFFFTSCPTICPIMKKEMLRVYEAFGSNPDFKILSHSIDPTHDTPEVLRDYAEKLGVADARTWNFLTGDQEKLFEIGQTSYLTTAMADQLEPGGFLHSGAFLLVDGQGRIRGVYDGTKSDQVDRLLADIPKLLEK